MLSEIMSKEFHAERDDIIDSEYPEKNPLMHIN